MGATIDAKCIEMLAKSFPSENLGSYKFSDPAIRSTNDCLKKTSAEESHRIGVYQGMRIVVVPQKCSCDVLKKTYA